MRLFVLALAFAFVVILLCVRGVLSQGFVNSSARGGDVVVVRVQGSIDSLIPLLILKHAIFVVGVRTWHVDHLLPKTSSKPYADAMRRVCDARQSKGMF